MNKKSIFFLLFVSITLFSVAQDTQGFFLDDWQPKSITSPSCIDTLHNIGSTSAVVNIDFSNKIAKVSKYVYGNNGNPYSGKMSADAVLLKYLNDLSPNVIRWPGGNLSQEYFWDRSTKPTDIPASAKFWGGIGGTFSNSEYYDLLSKTSSVGSICINVAYARYGTSANPVQTAAQYAANWVRYDKGRTKFWELGNENYGDWEAGYKIDTVLSKDHQPQIISGDLYGKICSVIIDSMRAAANEIGSVIKIGAVAYEETLSYDPVQTNWNVGLMKQIANKADFYIVHSYYTPYNQNSSVTTILNSANRSKDFAVNINSCLAAVGHGPMPVALTEWNIFAIGSKQAVSYVNGMHGTLVLGELIKNKYGMACRWNLSNGYSNGDDHGMFAATNETGVPYRTPHPQFHYMYFFQKCFGDQMLSSSVTGNTNVVAYASSFTSGHCGVVLTNKTFLEQKVNIRLANFKAGKRFYIYTLTGGTDNGSFSRKVVINGKGTNELAGGPANFHSIKPFGLPIDGTLKLSLPPLSVVYAVVDPAHVPDIEWAKVADNANIVKIKLTTPVIIPETAFGLYVKINNIEASINKIEKDVTDSTIISVTLSKAVVNTDIVSLLYTNGNLKTWNNIPMVEVSNYNVQNLLKGSAPVLLGARTDTLGANVYLSFNKKVRLPSSVSFKIYMDNLDKRSIAISAVSYFMGDSSILLLKVSEPTYLDYILRLEYTGNDVFATDGGKLSAIDLQFIRNYSPAIAPFVQKASLSANGDSIVLVFNKKLLFESNLKGYFKLTADGVNSTLRSVSLSDVKTNTIVVLPRIAIGKEISNVSISYTGNVLFSEDSSAVKPFIDMFVNNGNVSNALVYVAPAIQLYPNPANNMLNIKTNFNYETIEIFDLTGKLVFINEKKKGFQLNHTILLQLSKGMYVIKLKSYNQCVSRNFSVN